MHIKLLHEAESDLDAIQAYIEPRSPQGFIRVMTAILTTMEQLESFPLLGRVGEVEGTRELTVPGTDYRLIYRLNEPYDIEVIGVLHGRRRYPPADDVW